VTWSSSLLVEVLRSNKLEVLYTLLKWLGGAKGFLVFRASKLEGVVCMCVLLNEGCEFWTHLVLSFECKVALNITQNLKWKSIKVGPIACLVTKWLYIYFNISNILTHISNTKIKCAYESKEFVKHKFLKIAQPLINLCIVF